MTDDKRNKEVTSEVILADLMLRVASLEKLLVDKGIFTKEEFAQVNEDIAKKVAKTVLDKLQPSKEKDEFLANLNSKELKN